MYTIGSIWKNISTGNIIRLTSEPNLYDNYEAVNYAEALKDPHGYVTPRFTVSVFELEAVERPESIYISHADTNKLIRKTLKKAFPNVKFSVKKRHSVTEVSYQADIIPDDVKKVVGRFQGEDFDSMQDLGASINHYDAETHTVTQYGARFVNVSREYSLEDELARADFIAKHENFKTREGEAGIPRYEIKTYKFGSQSQYITYPDWQLEGYAQKRLQDFVWASFSKHASYEDMLADYGVSQTDTDGMNIEDLRGYL